MAPTLSYAIYFVGDMDRAIRFYRDTLGFAVKFQSPGWSELSTGETTIALHSSSAENPAGRVRLGINVPDLGSFHKELTGRGVRFTQTPTEMHGTRVARFVDSEGTEVSVSGR